MNPGAALVGLPDLVRVERHGGPVPVRQLDGDVGDIVAIVADQRGPSQDPDPVTLHDLIGPRFSRHGSREMPQVGKRSTSQIYGGRML